MPFRCRQFPRGKGAAHGPFQACCAGRGRGHVAPRGSPLPTSVTGNKSRPFEPEFQYPADRAAHTFSVRINAGSTDPDDDARRRSTPTHARYSVVAPELAEIQPALDQAATYQSCRSYSTRLAQYAPAPD